jgi:RNA polymerase-binding transcription factor DksA
LIMAKKKPASKPAKAAPKTKPGKVATKKAAAKKPAAKKPVAKKAAPKKAAAKKPAAKKPVAKKAAAKKAPAKKAPAKKAPAKKAAASKTSKPAPRPAAKPAAKAAAPKPAAPKPASAKHSGPTAKQTTASKTNVTKKPTNTGSAKTAGAGAAQDDTVKGSKAQPIEFDRPSGSYNGILLCEDVKPYPKKSPYSDKELEKLREALTAEREQLRRELVSLEGVGREALDLSREHPGYSVHMAEHATDLQTAEANMGLHRVELERLQAVEGALERLEKIPARYGLCLACGNKIGIQRLAARPHAHLCMDCQTRYERIKQRRGL